MFEKIKFWLVLFMALILVIFFLPIQSITNYITYEFSKKDKLILSLDMVNPAIKLLAADPDNKMVIKVKVSNSEGLPVPKAHVVLLTADGLGSIYPPDLRTDKFGEALATYIPPEPEELDFTKAPVEATLTANIYNSDIKSSITVKLVRAPVILVHGYLADGTVFDNLIDYLSAKGFMCSAINYDSTKGIISGSMELEAFLQQKKIQYLSKGIQVGRFDVVAHSLGGLITRYYTSSRSYIKNDDVKKIIFISTPQKGSPVAPIGAKYFKDQSIKDLIPDSKLFTTLFPKMLNKGLNSTIQVGSILGQFDEVVSPTSASLEEWNIETKMFSLGEGNSSMDTLLSGNLMDAPVHKGIISNKIVFEKIYSMLNQKLPYPAIRK